MTNYSGAQLVKQEACKLTYATFLSDVVVCYDRVANELVLNNPYFYETVYDNITKTLSNSAFSLRKVNLVSSYGTQFIINLDLNNTGLELILYADIYSRKQIIPYKHLTICDSVPCYDFEENFPYCKTVYYNDQYAWPCTGAGRELVITDQSEVTIEDNCMYSTCYDFTKTLGRELNFTEMVKYNDEVIWECFDLDREYNETTGYWIEDGPIIGIFKFFNGDIVVTDPKYIIDTCKETNQVSTPMGCMDPYISGTPCEIATTAMSIYQIPLVDVSFGTIINSLGYFEEFILEPNGNIVGSFYDSFESSIANLIYINLFNVYDYFNLHAYEVDGYKREISLAPYMYHKYFEGTQTNFDGDPDIENIMTTSELLMVFPSLSSATFNWKEVTGQSFGKAVGYRAPCDYKRITINNTVEGTDISIDYKFNNNFITNISSSGINATQLQADYDAFCNQAKWLLTSKAYAYAVYMGYLDPDTPIEY